jgi:DNA repair ATPase RecN
MMDAENELVEGLRSFVECKHDRLKCEKCGTCSNLQGWSVFDPRIAALESELAELRAQVHKCPECGMYCKDCECIAANVESLEDEIARLNEMLRKTGYGQGQIDAYAAECERADKAEAELARVMEQSERRLRLLREAQWKKVIASDFYCCRFCGALKHNGCKPGCELAAEVGG